MNNHDRARLFATLLTSALASTASAMDLAPSPAPSSPEAPGFSMPAFLDGARLPDLQAAWRAHFSAVATSDAAPAATPVAAPVAQTDNPVMQTSREAISRAEQVSREAASVRSRAEELSRRFTADPNATSDPPATEPPAPTETASIGDNREPAAPSADQPGGDVQVVAPGDGEVAAATPADTPVKKKAAATDAPVIEDMATVPPMGGKRSAAAPAPRQQAAQQPTARRAYLPSPMGIGASTKPDEEPMMPTELRSFGWASQP